jgi:LacI family transcriptional regulator
VDHVRDRIDAYRQALAERGSQCLTDETDHPVRGARDWLERIDELKTWLSQLPKPIGIYAPDLTEARDLTTACYELGIDVPEEVSLLGTGNDERCLLTSPNLSTVDFGSRRIGRRAAELLESLMEGKPAPSRPVCVEPVGVVARQSTDALAIRHPEVVRAVRWIRENIEYGPNVAEVAMQTDVSRRTLEMQFKKALDRTIGQEIRRCRVERAKLLLRKTQLPMIDVAIRSGFASRSHLNQEFRRGTDQTPKQYRRGQR